MQHVISRRIVSARYVCTTAGTCTATWASAQSSAGRGSKRTTHHVRWRRERVASTSRAFSQCETDAHTVQSFASLASITSICAIALLPTVLLSIRTPSLHTQGFELEVVHRAIDLIDGYITGSGPRCAPAPQTSQKCSLTSSLTVVTVQYSMQPPFELVPREVSISGQRVSEKMMGLWVTSELHSSAPATPLNAAQRSQRLFLVDHGPAMAAMGA